MLEQKCSDARLEDIVLPEELGLKIQRVINEYRKKEVLRKNGLKNRSKILIIGEPGTGKTMTASVIANEIGIPLYIIQLDKLVCRIIDI